jgi:exopolyphosphatase/guanosine-5'-triphosphate,3'-diphosphate pyrophosphatase
MVSTYSLREGLVVDTFAKMGRVHPEDTHVMRWKNVLAFADHFLIDHKFAKAVSDTALMIYDGFCKVGVIAREEAVTNEKELLQFASYLSEVGKAISYARYHKHSGYVIANSNIMGFTQSEKLFMSHVVRFHRRGFATKSKSDECPILARFMERINLLAVCLRIAVSLNRTRQSKVRSISFRSIKKDQLLISIRIRCSLRHFETEFAQVEFDLPAVERVLGLELILKVESR